MAKILVVEDSATIREELSRFLRGHGYEVVCPDDFGALAAVIPAENPDLILLDINLGDENGFALCRDLRRRYKLPVIFVTGRDREEDEILAMQIGGDDFIRKPYSLPVLLARIERLLRHRRPEYAGELALSGVRLDVVFSMLRHGEQELELSKNEFRILYYLFLNHGRVVTKDELIEYLWESKLYLDENILNVNISRLRKRLAAIGLQDFIETVPKQGYRL